MFESIITAFVFVIQMCSLYLIKLHLFHSKTNNSNLVPKRSSTLLLSFPTRLISCTRWSSRCRSRGTPSLRRGTNWYWYYSQHGEYTITLTLPSLLASFWTISTDWLAASRSNVTRPSREALRGKLLTAQRILFCGWFFVPLGRNKFWKHEHFWWLRKLLKSKDVEKNALQHGTTVSAFFELQQRGGSESHRQEESKCKQSWYTSNEFPIPSRSVWHTNGLARGISATGPVVLSSPQVNVSLNLTLQGLDGESAPNVWTHPDGGQP